MDLTEEQEERFNEALGKLTDIITVINNAIATDGRGPTLSNTNTEKLSEWADEARDQINIAIGRKKPPVETKEFLVAVEQNHRVTDYRKDNPATLCEHKTETVTVDLPNDIRSWRFHEKRGEISKQVTDQYEGFDYVDECIIIREV